MTLEQFARDIEQKQREARWQEHAKPYRPTATPASSLGYECTRRLVYLRLRPLDAEPVDDELASIFAEGDYHHAQIRRELSELGFEVVEAERPYRDERLDLTGHIDGKIILGAQRIPVEIKSLTGPGPKTEEEWRTWDSELMRRYFEQLQVYMLLSEEPEGLGLFKDKITGLWAACPVTLDYELGERLFKRAEAVRDAVRAVKEKGEAAMPERLASRAECPACPWRFVCLPAEAPVDPLLVARDEGLHAELQRRDELSQAAAEFKRLDSSIKARFRLTNGERFACGDYFVTKKPHGKGLRIIVEKSKLA